MLPIIQQVSRDVFISAISNAARQLATPKPYDHLDIITYYDQWDKPIGFIRQSRSHSIIPTYHLYKES